MLENHSAIARANSASPNKTPALRLSFWTTATLQRLVAWFPTEATAFAGLESGEDSQRFID